jgi:DNA (cytosine-5)-methyltransferase 1
MSGSIRFGSVCSGIEAASVAWGTLGWKAAWLSEIEPFPCAVLKHHYPDVPNYGDMTLLPARITSGEVEAPDLFCGGTPCQAFSVAGLRNSLDDARGNLSLTFCEIANAIDDRRSVRGESPSIVFWENVPGVLNTKDNAFGCFLGALAGEDEALIAPGGRWTNAGFIDGPQRAVAWRVLDAQYFGVAQRRRRVFVVASARDDFDPASVLFEFEGVRRDTAPSREARKVTPTISSSGTGVSRVGFNCEDEWFIETPVVGSYTPSSIGGYREGVGTLRANGGDIGGGSENLVATMLDHETVGALCADSHPGAYSGQDAYTGRLIPQSIAFENNRRDGARLYGDVSNTLQAFAGTGGGNGPMVAQPTYAIQGSMIGRNDNAGPQGDGINVELCFTQNTIDRHAVAQPIAFTTEQTPKFNSNQALTLTKSESKHNQCVAQPVGTDCFNGNITGDIACTMGTMGSSVNASGPTVMQSMAVRRLTPTECERLQGFPDGYTNIPWRKAAESPDGPRYKALGNSWAVPVVRWIGERIARAT